MSNTAEIIFVPLNKLEIDPLNVRKTYSQRSIEELAGSLAAQGILQNLLVRKAKGNGRYSVSAGGRRFRAALLLVEQGNLAADHPVPVKVISKEEAQELSLAENIMREAMLGSVSQLSCWVRTVVMVLGDIHRTYRGRHIDVRVKRSRSVARTTLEAAATPQAY